ncbi:uncharacterized protein BJ171DRAFT_570265 [Polychytrium aggregatum]|uniref:uncharacterized protein n=1 Tax=Polychytrium aggregatum TaxID=110093 RepID=UPI0022FE4BBB|nr:uncharacterized protein BJ171DRAFT_570265 [Polychytrium aggregatum]KAI9199693.1 hypothetical protein BJ171DRAFT_570265 [Polychytrium aggregatum]
MAFGVCLAVLVGGYVVPTSVTLYLGFSFYLIFGALTIPIPARQLSGLRPQVSAAQVNSTRVAALALVAVVGRLVPVSPVTPLLLSMALSMVVLYYTDLMNELLTSWVITTLVGFDYENLSLYWAEGVTFNEDFAVVDTTLLVRAYVWASAQVVLDSWFGLTPELTATRAASNTKCVD